MPQTLKQKTISGMMWSFIENFARMGLTFVIGIVLARLLSPKEFGIIGMTTIFIALSHTFINAGFTKALIRKKDCTETDLSTVFYFNLIAGTVLYGCLYLAAPAISLFFEQPLLTNVLRVLGVLLIIDSLTIIQRTILTKRVDFRLLTKISIIANILSGGVGIFLAYRGFGVWSLVYQKLLEKSLTSMLLWYWNRWIPLLVFSKQSFQELFAFGSKLLASSLLDTLWKNIYLLVIGKFFSAEALGFYTRAQMFKNLPSSNINSIISRVSFPVLAQLQDQPGKMKAAYKRLITSTMLITFVLMLGMAASAEAMILTLLGENWRESIPMLQLLCFVGMLYPLHALNLNMLNVQGRSDLFLKLEIIKKLNSIPVILIGIRFGVQPMILGMIVNNQISLLLNSYYSGRLIGYSYRQQMRDVSPTFLMACAIAVPVFMLGNVLPYSPPLVFLLQILLGGFLFIVLSEGFKLDSYRLVKDTMLEKARDILANRQITVRV